MSIMFAALNPNISEAQLLDLIKEDGDMKVKAIETFGACLDKCENNKQRMRYLNACLPVLIGLIF